ncbi:hypothetical protein AVEN_63157-1 [Araneus ventricosus]|uniref:Uncharacterized protein n=1 Tax=Araneus ventricosus TaxID=182803 RepID=A0A4Y2B0F1_ARAVE|nr:hypothetical protein AVEN_63157-1 [Araneus ventricosus]
MFHNPGYLLKEKVWQSRLDDGSLAVVFCQQSIRAWVRKKETNFKAERTSWFGKRARAILSSLWSQLEINDATSLLSLFWRLISCLDSDCGAAFSLGRSCSREERIHFSKLIILALNSICEAN